VVQPGLALPMGVSQQLGTLPIPSAQYRLDTAGTACAEVQATSGLGVQAHCRCYHDSLGFHAGHPPPPSPAPLNNHHRRWPAAHCGNLDHDMTWNIRLLSILPCTCYTSTLLRPYRLSVNFLFSFFSRRLDDIPSPNLPRRRTPQLALLWLLLRLAGPTAFAYSNPNLEEQELSRGRSHGPDKLSFEPLDRLDTKPPSNYPSFKRSVSSFLAPLCSASKQGQQSGRVRQKASKWLALRPPWLLLPLKAFSDTTTRRFRKP
jgi:hypothetical protein